MNAYICGGVVYGECIHYLNLSFESSVFNYYIKKFNKNIVLMGSFIRHDLEYNELSSNTFYQLLKKDIYSLN